MVLGDGYIAREMANLCRKLLVLEGSRKLVESFSPPGNCSVITGLLRIIGPKRTMISSSVPMCLSMW